MPRSSGAYDGDTRVFTKDDMAAVAYADVPPARRSDLAGAARARDPEKTLFTRLLDAQADVLARARVRDSFRLPRLARIELVLRGFVSDRPVRRLLVLFRRESPRTFAPGNALEWKVS